jgi:hypothetical protein
MDDLFLEMISTWVRSDDFFVRPMSWNMALMVVTLANCRANPGDHP